MTIQQYEERASVALSSSQDVAVQRLGEWAHSADAAYQVAERLSSSAFVPAQFKGKPVELCAAILSGLEVGLSPMAAMRSFDIIQGQAAPRAITLRAIVQSHGHEMVLIESTASRCRMRGRRRGSEEWQTVTWDMARAQALGLTSKDNWKKQPGAMLLARATSELARLIASDAILGIGYSSEEVADGGTYEEQVAAETTTPSSNGTRRMGRPKPSGEEASQGVTSSATDSADVRVGVDSPSPESEPEDAEVVDELTDKTRKTMFALFGERGIDDRERQIAGIIAVIGRQIESRAEITETEAQMVIASLRSQS